MLTTIINKIQNLRIKYLKLSAHKKETRERNQSYINFKYLANENNFANYLSKDFIKILEQATFLCSGIQAKEISPNILFLACLQQSIFNQTRKTNEFLNFCSKYGLFSKKDILLLRRIIEQEKDISNIKTKLVNKNKKKNKKKFNFLTIPFSVITKEFLFFVLQIAHTRFKTNIVTPEIFLFSFCITNLTYISKKSSDNLQYKLIREIYINDRKARLKFATKDSKIFLNLFKKSFKNKTFNKFLNKKYVEETYLTARSDVFEKTIVLEYIPTFLRNIHISNYLLEKRSY